MKILLIGSGGREHALAQHFSANGHQVYCLPGNAGTDSICTRLPSAWLDLGMLDTEGLVRLATALEIDLTVVGPEQPLELGIGNAFKRAKLPIFGPTTEAAQLETSKVFAKDFMSKYGVPTARYHVCHEPEEAYAAAKEYCSSGNAVVVKPGGLTAGKGVTICHSLEEARVAIDLIMTQGVYGEAGTDLVVEEFLQGQEVSILAFCDGVRMEAMPPSQDHKQLFDGDKGPNTGGMGAYTPAPCVDDKLMHEIQHHIINRTQTGLRLEGIAYSGVLYFGIMLTDAGPRVLEYNCRFGDPEAQALLPLAESDLSQTMLACTEGDIRTALPKWKNESCVCVVMCAKGYPGPFAKGSKISGTEHLANLEDLFVYYAGTERELDGSLRSSGGRVLSVSALAPSLEAAIDKAYSGIRQIRFEGAFFRSDIAAKAMAVL